MYPSFAIVKFHQKNENEEKKNLSPRNACYLKFTIDKPVYLSSILKHGIFKD